MPAFTVQELIDRAAAIADIQDDFVAPTEWLAWLKPEQRALELFVARCGYDKQTTLATADSADNYRIELTGSPLAIIGVYEVRDGRYRRLKLQNLADFTRQSLTSAADTGDAHYYSAMTPELIDPADPDMVEVNLYPKPTSGTYICLYLNGESLPEALDDSVIWPLGWEERLVLGLAERALSKEESDTRAIEKLIAKQEQVIEEFCWSRALADAPQVRNTDRVERGWTSTMVRGTHESWHWL
jgi:hypothetical protein